MTAVGTLARVLVPVGLPMAAYYACEYASRRWKMSKQYPPALVCQIVAILFLLCIGVAWACGEPSTSKDLSYLILTVLIAASMVLNCKDAQEYRQMVANVAVFMVAFLIYSGADGGTSEKVVLAPAISVLLVDLILLIQAVGAQ